MIRTGNYPITEGVLVEVANKDSFGRVAIHAAQQWRFDAYLDYVPAPAAWGLVWPKNVVKC